MPPLSNTHKVRAQTEYLFVCIPRLWGTAFGEFFVQPRNWASMYIYMCWVVEYCASGIFIARNEVGAR